MNDEPSQYLKWFNRNTLLTFVGVDFWWKPWITLGPSQGVAYVLYPLWSCASNYLDLYVFLIHVIQFSCTLYFKLLLSLHYSYLINDKLVLINFVCKHLLPVATKLGQGNVFTGVCDSVHRGAGCLPQCMLGYHPPPREQTPSPGADTPQSRHPPLESRLHPPPGADTTTPSPQDQTPKSRHPPPLGSRCQHTVNERPVRILLECILVFISFSYVPIKTYLIEIFYNARLIRWIPQNKIYK